MEDYDMNAPMMIPRLALLAMLVVPTLIIADDPPFPTTISYKGTSSFVRSNWTLTGAENDALMDVDSLRLYDTSEGTVSLQLIPSVPPGSGKTVRAAFRLKIDHLGDNFAKFGLWSTDGDPFDGEPSRAAYFDVRENVRCGRSGGACPEEVCEEFDCCTPGDCYEGCPTEECQTPHREYAKVYAFVHTSAGGDPDPEYLYELNDLEEHDFLLEVNGTTEVNFYHKAPAENTWTGPTTLEIDLSGDDLRYSMAIKCFGGSQGHIAAAKLEFDGDD
jgi:hypothetical protein